MGKIILARANLIRLGRMFDCYLIKWLYDFDNNNVWDDDIYIIDYVSREGLIERSLIITGIYFANEEMEILGTADLYELYELSEFSLKKNRANYDSPLGYQAN